MSWNFLKPRPPKALGWQIESYALGCKNLPQWTLPRHQNFMHWLGKARRLTYYICHGMELTTNLIKVPHPAYKSNLDFHPLRLPKTFCLRASNVAFLFFSNKKVCSLSTLYHYQVFLMAKPTKLFLNCSDNIFRPINPYLLFINFQTRPRIKDFYTFLDPL